MADHVNRKLENAVASLARVRAAESEFDAEGLKTVWHQGAKGADLLSWVDQKGHVTRQDLTLLEDHFRWTSRAGLQTGSVGEGGGSQAVKASDTVAFDSELDPDRLRRAHAALLGYKGEDRYILHVRRVLGLAVAGLEERNESTVTRSMPSGATLPVVQAEPKKKPGLPMWVYVVCGVIIGGGVAAALLMR